MNLKKKIAGFIGIGMLAVCLINLPNHRTNVSLADDVKLSELLVFPGDLETGFSPDVQDYNVYVPADSQELLISAVAMSGSSSVSVSKPDVLAYGENLAVIQIYSPSGNMGEYRVHVFRGDYPAAEDLSSENVIDVDGTLDADTLEKTEEDKVLADKKQEKEKKEEKNKDKDQSEKVETEEFIRPEPQETETDQPEQEQPSEETDTTETENKETAVPSEEEDASVIQEQQAETLLEGTVEEDTEMVE